MQAGHQAEGEAVSPEPACYRKVIGMEQILNSYYADNAKKLHKVVDKILLKFGGLSNKDLDDFYSLADEVFAEVIKRYDREQSFEGFLYSCLLNRIKNEITRRNCYKRTADRMAVSIDTPVGTDEGFTIGDMIPGSFDMDKAVFENGEDRYSKKMTLYLGRLSRMQKEILRLIIAGYHPHEIRTALDISEKEYSDGISAIHSYRNVSVLF